MSPSKKIRPRTLVKYRAIQDRYKHLYNVERLRIDDVLEKLCEEFFLGPHRLNLVLSMELDEKEPVE